MVKGTSYQYCEVPFSGMAEQLSQCKKILPVLPFSKFGYKKGRGTTNNVQ